MKLWFIWYKCVHYFQPACSRSRTFMFLVLALVGFSIRPECAGVTSFIRASFLKSNFYKGFLHFFNYSTGLNLAYLTARWCELAHRIFPVHRVGGYFVYVADGLKVAKEGKKMPGVKKFRSVDRELAYKRHDYLQAAKSLSDIPPLRSIHLHALSGDRKGQWAISLNGPWRLCFEFKEGDAYNVELVDYHK